MCIYYNSSDIPLSPLSPPFAPLSPTSRGEGSASVSSFSTTPSRNEKLLIPNFWRDETQECIEIGVLDDESRSDITRTLVTLLTAKYGPKPGKGNLQELARQLILKHPFVKDDMGSDYVSLCVQ